MTAPPHDPQAELEVLGAALDSTWTRSIDLDPADLYLPDHRRLAEVITTLQAPIRPCDLPDDLRPLAKKAVGAWVNPDKALAAVRRCAAARRAISRTVDLADAARNLDVDKAAQLAHEIAEDLDAA